MNMQTEKSTKKPEHPARSKSQALPSENKIAWAAAVGAHVLLVLIFALINVGWRYDIPEWIEMEFARVNQHAVALQEQPESIPQQPDPAPSAREQLEEQAKEDVNKTIINLPKRRMLENDLREAVRTKSLGLAFQPLIDAETEATTGFEALVRWNHPEQGQIPPDDFIPVAERIGLISQIGQWVLNEACSQATQWPNNLRVAVNLSPQQFRESQVVDHVKWALETSGLDPHRLELEITESLFIQNTDDVMSALSQLKEMGVSIALDDFGTGYSSLSYLLKFPFDKLKIDRTFISSINEDAVARDVLEAITKLGRILNLSVTAEGVETHDQAESLKAMACTHFQGFHFGRPLGPADLGAYLLREFERKVEPAPAAKKPVRARRRKAAKAS